MFIKSLKLEGFKSYKNQTVFGPFHEGFNIVVGRNGSGELENKETYIILSLLPTNRVRLSGARLCTSFAFCMPIISV